MGGCATKPLVLKEETEAIKPVEDVAEPVKADWAEEAGSWSTWEEQKEAEEAAVAAGEENPPEENEKASTEEAESKPEVSEFHAEDAPADEKQQ